MYVFVGSTWPRKVSALRSSVATDSLALSPLPFYLSRARRCSDYSFTTSIVHYQQRNAQLHAPLLTLAAFSDLSVKVQTFVIERKA